MEFVLRPLTEAEEKYTYSQSMQISMQTGLLGYLRADMGRNGTDFFSDWFDFRKELKTEDFKREFDEMIESYRKGGKFLSNRNALTEFCQTLKCFKNDDRSFGVRIDSDNYAYLCRLNPDRSEYNLYCFAYKKDWLNRHIHEAENGIRFVSFSSRELFRINDGDGIRILYPDGKYRDCICRYVDPYHFETDNTVWHIFQFSERMNEHGARVMAINE